MLVPFGVASKGLQIWKISMCTSLLYHTFGIRGYEYVRTEYQGGQVIFTINQDLKTCRCSACGHARSGHEVGSSRRFRALPIGSRVTTLVLPIPRVQCLACGVVRQVEIPFADPRGALKAEAHGQQPRSLSFKGAFRRYPGLWNRLLWKIRVPFRTPPEFYFFIVDKDWAECYTSQLDQSARAVQRSCPTLIEKARGAENSAQLNPSVSAGLGNTRIGCLEKTLENRLLQ